MVAFAAATRRVRPIISSSLDRTPFHDRRTEAAQHICIAIRPEFPELIMGNLGCDITIKDLPGVELRIWPIAVMDGDNRMSYGVLVVCTRHGWRGVYALAFEEYKSDGSDASERGGVSYVTSAE